MKAASQVFTYKQLQHATNNFSPVNVVGHGGFGSVFRAVLADGRLAAIKQLDRAGKQGEHEFRVEVRSPPPNHSSELKILLPVPQMSRRPLEIVDTLVGIAAVERLACLKMINGIAMLRDVGEAWEGLHWFIVPEKPIRAGVGGRS